MSRHKNVSRDGDETIHLWGKEAIEEQINEVTFDLSPRAFFQLNPQQTELLYGEGIKALDVQPNETIVDAYCGVGTIGKCSKTSQRSTGNGYRSSSNR